MTKVCFFCCAAFVISCFLRAADVPPEMERLRDSYNAAVNRAVQPLTRTYLDELKKLRDLYTRSANLDAANAVEAEVQAIGKDINGLAPTAAIGKNVPPDMERLRSSYNTVANRAVLPLTRTYLDELKKLRDLYTRNANLEAANAVEAEIQASAKSSLIRAAWLL